VLVERSAQNVAEKPPLLNFLQYQNNHEGALCRNQPNLAKGDAEESPAIN
jgi:hypothetical protein